MKLLFVTNRASFEKMRDKTILDMCDGLIEANKNHIRSVYNTSVLDAKKIACIEVAEAAAVL